MQERTALGNQIDGVLGMERRLRDTIDLIEMAESEQDQAMVAEAMGDLRKLYAEAQKRQLESLLSDPMDKADAFLEVNAGAGGTEAQDWADMLLRQYMRWAERRGYKVEMQSYLDGEGAGIKSASMLIKGHNAFGWAKTESGVHRLVRISPFDSNAKRHTSFASIAVSPMIDDTIDIVVEEKDLRVDTYRSSGAGGQHVNTTDSAVRITHIPTNTVVSCQMERSQHSNREKAMKMLKAKLYEIERLRREEQALVARGEKTDIGWGHQIRSYVLHPYQMVKDLRTGVETSDTQGVLDGDLDAFIEASLSQRVGRK
jgi:peptide chain release factor 2